MNKTLVSCGDTLAVSVGQATATDGCVASLVPSGQVISKNGVALNPPLPVVNGQATLGIGTYVVSWTASDGSNTVTANQAVVVAPAIETSRSFLVDDRAQLTASGGGFAAILNAGSGTTRVGQKCTTGGIVSQSAVTVQHGSTVNGNIVTGGKANVDTDATVTGTRTENAAVQLPALPVLPAFPAPTKGTFTVNSGSQTFGPGSYTSGTVNGGTLTLLAGDYFFQSLTINANTTVRVAPTTRIFVRNTLALSSPFRGSGSAAQSITLGFAGSTTLNLTSVFNGTLIAPNATVNFGSGSGLTYTGSFFGAAFEVEPGSTLVCAPN